MTRNSNFFYSPVLLFLVIMCGCGSDRSTIIVPGEGITQEYWWNNYLDENSNPLTLPSGFKLVPAQAEQRTATPLTSNYQGIVLTFAIDPDYRSNLGYIFRGDDQNNGSKENLAGAVEFIKQSGRLRRRETFDWEGLREDPPGSFKFTRINRFSQFQIRTPFNGFAYDLMSTLLSDPYVGYPTDTTKTWSGDPVHVSDGSGREFVEILSYRIRYLGTRSLAENGTNILSTYDDVIIIEGRTNEGLGRIDAYLAPNVGIIYYHLVTAFGQEGAGALIGFSGENIDLNGRTVTDYFPTSPGNHWLYEFAPDNHVPEFRFSIQ